MFAILLFIISCKNNERLSCRIKSNKDKQISFTNKIKEKYEYDNENPKNCLNKELIPNQIYKNSKNNIRKIRTSN
jgi:hypothetical protein